MGLYFLLLSKAGQVVLKGSLLQVVMGLPFQNLSLPRAKMNHSGNVSIARGGMSFSLTFYL